MTQWEEWRHRVQRVLRDAGALVPHRLLAIAGGLPRNALHRENAVVIAGVAALHVVFLWPIVLSLRMPHAHVDTRELQVVLAPAERHETPIALPQSPLVASIPEIVVDDDDAPQSTIAAASAALVLAPRPDPRSANVPPTLAAVGTRAGQGAVGVVLRIFVLVDGSISEARVVASSGQSDTDAKAIDYVKANWRFIPAKLNGSAIAYWTTVNVPFRADG